MWTSVKILRVERWLLVSILLEVTNAIARMVLKGRIVKLVGRRTNHDFLLILQALFDKHTDPINKPYN